MTVGEILDALPRLPGEVSLEDRSRVIVALTTTVAALAALPGTSGQEKPATVAAPRHGPKLP